MELKTPIDPNRIRYIGKSFSWIDHRLLSDGFLAGMTCNELALYFFLVLVGDKNGMSFYSQEKICALVKLSQDEFFNALNQLCVRSLIACENQRYQVLQLPPKIQPKAVSAQPIQRTSWNIPVPLKRIFQEMGQQRFS